MQQKILSIFSFIILAGAAALIVYQYHDAPSPQPATPGPTRTTTIPQTTTVTGTVYETDHLKITVVKGWTATEAAKNSATVNITKGNYILFVNTQAYQASGVEGGRFAEIGMGAPSVDLVVKDEPNECGAPETNPALPGHPRVDLYINARENTNPACVAPSDDKSRWFFSYIAKGSAGNYFNDENGYPGYVITMAYRTTAVNALPEKGSSSLNEALQEMTAMVKTLVIK